MREEKLEIRAEHGSVHPLTPHVGLQGLFEMLGAHTDGHVQKHWTGVC